VQLELIRIPERKDAEKAPKSHRASWSQSVARGQSAPLVPLTLETLTEFDPLQNRYRDGQWTA
jgi:hypothetical protein